MGPFAGAPGRIECGRVHISLHPDLEAGARAGREPNGENRPVDPSLPAARIAAEEAVAAGLAYRKRGRWRAESRALVEQLRSDMEPARRGEICRRAAELLEARLGDQADPWTLIERRTDFQQLAVGATPQRLLGIPQVAKTLQQGRSGDPHARPYAVPLLKTVPTLTVMTRAALNVLDNDPDGFFLMIEGGAVDWASHDNQSGRMLEEQLDFDRTVAAVVRWVENHSSWDETQE